MSTVFDLNIENYKIEDLLNLFHIDSDFDLTDLKEVKRIALQTHPDKSKLPNEYFLFFMSAYNIIKDVWFFKNKSLQSRENLEFDDTESLDTFFQKNKDLDFHQWFNDAFNKVYVKDEKGYEKWFRQEGEEHVEVEEKELQQQAVVVAHPFQKGNCFGYDLVEGETCDYSSDSYADLMQAHTKQLPRDNNIPERTMMSVSELEMIRQQPINPLSESESMQLLEMESKQEEHAAVKRAYELVCQSRNHKDFSWKRLL